MTLQNRKHCCGWKVTLLPYTPHFALHFNMYRMWLQRTSLSLDRLEQVCVCLTPRAPGILNVAFLLVWLVLRMGTVLTVHVVRSPGREAPTQPWLCFWDNAWTKYTDPVWPSPSCVHSVSEYTVAPEWFQKEELPVSFEEVVSSKQTAPRRPGSAQYVRSPLQQLIRLASFAFDWQD